MILPNPEQIEAYIPLDDVGSKILEDEEVSEKFLPDLGRSDTFKIPYDLRFSIRGVEMDRIVILLSKDFVHEPELVAEVTSYSYQNVCFSSRLTQRGFCRHVSSTSMLYGHQKSSHLSYRSEPRSDVLISLYW